MPQAVRPLQRPLQRSTPTNLAYAQLTALQDVIGDTHRYALSKAAATIETASC